MTTATGAQLAGGGAQYGGGAYGAVPGPLNIPQNIYSQVNQAIPGFSGVGSGAAGVIGSQVAGQVPPDVQNLLQGKAAAMGIGGGGGVGQAGSFTANNFLASLGQNSEQQQDTGIQNYLKFLGGVGATQTDPNLAFTVAQQNDVNAAAPNPAAAAYVQQNDFEKYMNMVRGNSGPTGVSWTGNAGQTFAGTPGS